MPPSNPGKTPASLVNPPPLELDPAPPPLDAVPVPPPAQAPDWHVIPTAEQSSQATPSVPQYVSTGPVWHAPVMSQQPLQGWFPHIPEPPLEPLLDPPPDELPAPPSSFPEPELVEPPQPPSTIRDGTNIVATMRIAMLMSSPPPPGRPDELRVPSGPPYQARTRFSRSKA
jgi:hypothetical protein